MNRPTRIILAGLKMLALTIAVVAFSIGASYVCNWIQTWTWTAKFILTGVVVFLIGAAFEWFLTGGEK